MISRVKITVLFILWVWVAQITAQDTSDHQNPFRQGRWFLGLDGNVRSSFQTSAFNLFDDLNFTNGYLLNIKSGYFTRDRLPIGPYFSISRQNVQENIAAEFELLKIGGWFRYYLAKNSKSSLYPDIAFVFANYYAHSEYQHIVNPFDIVLRGVGPGVILGLGFNYVIKDIAALEINLNYNYSYFFGEERDLINQTDKYKQFSIGEIQLTLGFAVLLKD